MKPHTPQRRIAQSIGAHCRTLLLAVVLLSTNGCVYLFYKSVQQDREVAAMHGKEYSYKVANSPVFLTEDFVVSTARETLRREGFDTNQWTSLPLVYRPGTTNLQRMSVTFRNGETRRRFDVWLDDRKVICQSQFTGKRRKPSKPARYYPKPPRTGKG